MLRSIIFAVSMLSLAAGAPAAAQFPFGLGTGSRKADSKSDGGCKLSGGKRRGSAIAGGFLGGLANRAIGGRASAITSFVPVNLFATTLTDAIACKLDKDEQAKAAAATDQAIAGGVGSKASWSSATRQGVTGSSVVTAQNTRADGGTCMTVSDVIIVEGEETTVSKQMCRASGGSGYILSA